MNKLDLEHRLTSVVSFSLCGKKRVRALQSSRKAYIKPISMLPPSVLKVRQKAIKRRGKYFGYKAQSHPLW